MKLFIAGHNGMVGSAISNHLKKDDSIELLTIDRNELDLTDQKNVQNFLTNQMPDAIIISAAKVGGIYANNTFPAEFLYQNLMIQNNLIHGSYLAGIKKLLFLGSSCIYPKNSDQPIQESSLLTGKLEPTNEPYAIAKIAGIKMCESYNRQYGMDYRSIMPTNLYGERDNFHPDNSHVVPALIKRFHEAKISSTDNVTIWGDGSPLREFLHVDDMARASIYIMNLDRSEYQKNTEPMLSHINIGSGHELSIKDLALLVKEVVGYKGEIIFDKSKPNGTMRKLLDSSKLHGMGWKAKIDIKSGLTKTYHWYKTYLK
jgi:GDP-L-fucose synthase